MYKYLFFLLVLYTIPSYAQQVYRFENEIDRLKKQKEVIFCKQSVLNCNIDLLQNLYKLYDVAPKAKAVYYFNTYSKEDEKRILDYFQSVSSDFRNKYAIVFNETFENKYRNFTDGSAFRIVGDSVKIIFGNRHYNRTIHDSIADVNLVYYKTINKVNYPLVASRDNKVYWFDQDKGILNIERTDGLVLDTFRVYKSCTKMLDRYYESIYPAALSYSEVCSTRNIFFIDTSKYYKGNGEVEFSDFFVLNDSQVLYTGILHYVEYADRRAKISNKWIVGILNNKSKKLSIRPVIYSDMDKLNNLYLSTPSLSQINSGKYRLSYSCLFKETSKVVDSVKMNPFVFMDINVTSKPEFSDLIEDSIQITCSNWLNLTSNGFVDLRPFAIGNGLYLVQMPPKLVYSTDSSERIKFRLPFNVEANDFFRSVNIYNKLGGYTFYEHIDYEHCKKAVYRTKDWVNHEKIVELPCNYIILQMIHESKFIINDYESDRILIKEISLKNR
jgi:hypothetical protein